jgi:hypothetical protein
MAAVTALGSRRIAENIHGGTAGGSKQKVSWP